ncbi:MAG: segregation/condensation protein A [Parcubacteria group bacterium]
MAYHVRTDKFEGPMELLLELIQKEKLDITELSMAKVTDEYLEHIRSNQDIHLEHMADFLTVAARLILIKSKAILPTLKFSEEEEEEIKDLTYQLEEYKKFKEAAVKLGHMTEEKRFCYSREGFANVAPIFYPPEDINAYDLKKYFMSVLAEIPIIEKLQEEIVNEVVTLEERINELEGMLREKIQSSFSSLVEDAKDKVDVIISFLAMLEMVKQRLVQVEQGELFSEISLSLKGQ